MKKSIFAVVATVMTLSSQNLYALEGHCADQAQKAAEAVHEINNEGTKAAAQSVEVVAYAGYHNKQYQVKIQDKQYAVNVFEFESAGTSCEVNSVVAQSN